MSGTPPPTVSLTLPTGKPIDIGEGGAILARDWNLWETVARQACHPVRQLVGGIEQPHPTGVGCRPHPWAAVLLATALRGWSPEPLRERHCQAVKMLHHERPDLHVVGKCQRRQNASAFLPIHKSQRIGSPHSRLLAAGLCDIASILAGTRPGQVDVDVLPVDAVFPWMLNTRGNGRTRA